MSQPQSNVRTFACGHTAILPTQPSSIDGHASSAPPDENQGHPVPSRGTQIPLGPYNPLARMLDRLNQLHQQGEAAGQVWSMIPAAQISPERLDRYLRRCAERENQIREVRRVEQARISRFQNKWRHTWGPFTDEELGKWDGWVDQSFS
ncbi:MAG: hypothetical protein M1816_004767 [Peltula sp. TS41687]|nr:MAG: hypothetical protein M1816_004767 [Peltula sp. TS41687]